VFIERRGENLSTLLIKNGRVVDPASRVDAKLNLYIEDGRIELVTKGEPEADTVIDASGKIVAPGFIDIHMHEDNMDPDGTRYSDPEKSVFCCELRMGVTTCLGGNCGENACDPGEYLDMVDRDGAPVNIALLAGHSTQRLKSGHRDKYTALTDDELKAALDADRKALDDGCLGISYGIRYIPGIDERELKGSASLCVKDDKMIAAHVRDDAAAVFDSAAEFLDVAEELGLNCEFSHIGSMAGFGQMKDFLEQVDEYKMNGLRVNCDCYPYYAFSTAIGSTTFDDGFLERYDCGYDVIEICEGKYKGMRCTEDIFRELRKTHPSCLAVAHVMKPEDIDLAFSHPNVMLCTDATLHEGQGHPRAAGSYPRLLSKFVKAGKISLGDAIEKMTTMPAEKLGLVNKGRLSRGADADVCIFDPERVEDRATFDSPLTAPEGIDYVIIAGKIASVDGKVIDDKLGRAVRR